jgi:hypothetical protein
MGHWRVLDSRVLESVGECWKVLESVGECFVFYGIGKVLENVRHIVSVWDRCEIEWGTMGQCWECVVVDIDVFNTVVFENSMREC